VDTPEVEVIDVERDGRWCQVLLLEVSSGADARVVAEHVFTTRDRTRFTGVISADLGPDVPEILDALRPGLMEIVCFDAITDPTEGQTFAMRALEQLGFGQDFVFTVPQLEAATEYAVATLLRPDHGGWEGRFVAVVGPRAVLDRAHRHLTEPR
jgi:hypothetical protein